MESAPRPSPIAYSLATVGLRPNRFWKRSMRPAESINFCLPVKNGWQLEQISTMNESRVEPVLYVAPQAHVMVTALYSG